jgi:hypothetical protein
MENLFKDIKYGFRGLLKRKGFAAIAVLTLALGIGANTAIFTLVNAVMLKSLPVQKPEELVLFTDTTSEGTSVEDTPRTGVWTRVLPVLSRSQSIICGSGSVPQR